MKCVIFLYEDEDLHPSQVRAELVGYSTKELDQLATMQGIKPNRRGRRGKDAFENTLSDAFVVFPIDELMRKRNLSAHAACRIIASRLRRRPSWPTHWKRYQRARNRSSFKERTLGEFLRRFLLDHLKAE